MINEEEEEEDEEEEKEEEKMYLIFYLHWFTYTVLYIKFCFQGNHFR